MVCTRCNKERGDNFANGKRRCRPCLAEIARERYAADPEKHKEKSRRNRKERAEKVNAANRQYRKANPGRARAWARRSKRKANGWHPGRWEALLAAQEGICAVRGCGRPATDADHDHVTGKARGAICSGCNKALGLLGDSLERVQGLARYLSDYAEDAQA